MSDKWASLDADSKAEFEALAQKQKRDHAADLARLKEEDPAAYESHIRAVKRREDEAVSGPGAGGKKKKKRAEYDDDPADGHDPDNPPPELSYFDSIVKSLKVKKQTKSDLNDDEQKEVEMAFIEKMMAAAKADEVAAEEKKPAVHKLKMLPQVQAQLSKSDDKYEQRPVKSWSVWPALVHCCLLAGSLYPMLIAECLPCACPDRRLPTACLTSACCALCARGSRPRPTAHCPTFAFAR